MEHFINVADNDIGAKIREKRFTVFKEAATSADDRVLARRVSGPKPEGGAPVARERPAGGVISAIKTLNKSSTSREGEKSSGRKSRTSSPKVTCFYCKQTGHIKPHCTKWKATQEAKPVALSVGSSQVGGRCMEDGKSEYVTPCSLGSSLGETSPERARNASRMTPPPERLPQDPPRTGVSPSCANLR